MTETPTTLQAHLQHSSGTVRQIQHAPTNDLRPKDNGTKSLTPHFFLLLVTTPHAGSLRTQVYDLPISSFEPAASVTFAVLVGFLIPLNQRSNLAVKR